ncbi:MAG: hypothetical protein GF317_14970 [Candidatus Lokiarchaeota archaeon]|nr:hypothetical protein [Candidatus Lokiarchaeota archaeon]MBD3200894.1 hypothetical protein [Candidatus Lokiarchaeota archaeon]
MENSQNFNKKKRRLVDTLVKNNLLKDKRLYKAFLEVPLEDFIPKRYRDDYKIYEDIPNLFYYQNPQNYRTISAPHMITIMLQGLSLQENDDLLILGAKSGYIAALANKLSPLGEIIVLEANSEIAKLTQENLENLNLGENVSVIVKNPLEGMPELSPWQKILVTGAIKEIRIYPLLRQLDSDEGVLYAPIGEEYIQTYTQILRMKENFYGKKQLQVRFTPLMTQVELDEIELITDFDEIKEIEVEINPKKVEETLEKVNIQYETSIIDEIDVSKQPKIQSLEEKERNEAIKFLSDLEKIANRLRREDEIENCFGCIEEMEALIESLKNFKKDLGLKVKKLQTLINQIMSYNVIRKELEKKVMENPDFIDKKIEIINKQIEEINKLKEIIKSERNRL